jgi:hypothetical protein
MFLEQSLLTLNTPITLLTMKVIINACFGGFALSKRAVQLYHQYAAAVEPAGERLPQLYPGATDRSDPMLVRVVEELGADANGQFASLRVLEIPDDVEWTIEDHDGFEHVAEVHRVWEWTGSPRLGL